MNIIGFTWFNDIIEKLEHKHSVNQDEVREVFRRKPIFRFVENGIHTGENVYAALGRTNAGRFLIIFFIYKKDRHALIVSARNMTFAERKKYEKKS